MCHIPAQWDRSGSHGRLLRKPLAHIWLLLFFLWASLVARRVRICLQCGRPGFDLWVEKILWRRKWQPTPVFLPREFHGQRILAGYSPWGCKESDTTEQLSRFLLCPLPSLLPEIQMRGPMWGHYLGDQKEWKNGMSLVIRSRLPTSGFLGIKKSKSWLS